MATDTLRYSALLLALVLAACGGGTGGCPAPELRVMPAGDAAADAAGTGQMFESIVVPGFTDRERGTAGVALADFDGDGRPDILSVHDAERRLRLLMNRGCFDFSEQPLTIAADGFDAADLGRGANIPNVVDFDGDGRLDVYLSRSRGPVEAPSVGNNLLLADGAFHRFRDVGRAMGVDNPGAYSRQSAFGDVNGDGYLDIAVAADNIGNTRAGVPQQRLYLYQPSSDGVFSHGRFEPAVVPDFGAEFQCDAEVDRASPGIVLSDLDGDGDLDLLQGYHADMNHERWDDACAAGEYAQGIFVWRNDLVETGSARFERVTDNGLAGEGRMRYRPDLGYYVAETPSVGLPYLTTADVDNDGQLDVLAVGPTDPEWHVNAWMIAGRLWRNLGGLLFGEQTAAAGLEPLNWTYRDWEGFWDAELASQTVLSEASCAVSNQQPLCAGLTVQDHQFYAGDAVFGDFDNDTLLDFVLVDRHELDGEWGDLRNVLFMNRGGGRFEPVATEDSGIDSNSVAAETADLNGDGLLDLVLLADPENSYNLPQPPLPADRYRNKVYWNTGAGGGRDNHWLAVRFSGLPQRLLVGARAALYDANGQRLGSRELVTKSSNKSAHGLTLHFGLGQETAADLRLRLPDGREFLWPGLAADQSVTLPLQ